jgi:hypothetical protein
MSFFCGALQRLWWNKRIESDELAAGQVQEGGQGLQYRWWERLVIDCQAEGSR